MAQNIYDTDEFFANYSKLPRSIDGLAAAPEWPSLRAMLPDIRGRKVLDLGCGFGWFCRWARENGASEILGIDLSEKMLARAASATNDSAITYRKADLEHVELSAQYFDLVYSSLAFHYVKNFNALIASIHKSLKPGASLVFSVEHPIYTAPSNPKWITNPTGRKVWPLDNYLIEGPRSTDWLANGVIKQHRTIATYINALLSVGMTITHIDEWAPSKEQIAQHPDWADERQRPSFLLISALR
ncbi:MAG TPA: class I SAM-dependent methyltransferase [Candidatus Binataceae bacterium]|nr:class I SAM-dependent methyltransferase [Candidatus Binataceae bacterium]